jgi:hypothetical protein
MGTRALTGAFSEVIIEVYCFQNAESTIRGQETRAAFPNPRHGYPSGAVSSMGSRTSFPLQTVI